jgi:predicted dienelactone hydrolase
MEWCRTLAFISAIVVVVWLAGPAASIGKAQNADIEAHTLPAPTGRFDIGQVTADWNDESRRELLSPNREPRELLIHIWYPAEKSDRALAPYLNAAVFEEGLGMDRMKRELKGAYDAIMTGRLPTHARVAAPFANEIKRAPLLLFSPGGGMVPEFYTAQLEDLASHGYIVAAITHVFDAMVTVFPDGRRIIGSNRRWPTSPSFPEEVNLNQLKWHTEDVRFVLDRLLRTDRDTSLPFAGHIDTTRIGAFGHSFGGEAAAHACQTDHRLMACLNQDGLASMAPYYLDARGWGMDQAFMLIQRSPETGPPPAEELAAMRMTLNQAETTLARLTAYQEATLRNTGKGSYQVFLRNKQTTHMHFSDLPLLQTSDPEERRIAVQVMEIVRSYTRAFFDKSLTGKASPLLERSAEAGFVDGVRRFKPGKRP